MHAPYGDSVFVVEDEGRQRAQPGNGPDGKPAKVARQQFVRLGLARGDFVAIDDGIRPGQEVVTPGAFKLRNGSPVVVNNQRQARRRSLTPQPENR